MQPTVKSQVFPFLCLAALLGVASGLTVERVRLVNNLTYIDYGLGASPNNSLLECVYHLDVGEEVYQVFWEMGDDSVELGTYEWFPDSGGNATGSLEGVVELNRDDGSLELTKLRYDLGGMYSCGVSLTDEVTKNTTEEEVLIVDINGGTTFREYDQGCICTNSYQSPTVFPEPALHAGIFSPKLNEYYEEITSQEWLKVIHPNGSVTSSYNLTNFVINQNTPDDALFLLTMGIVKSDGEYISLDRFSSYGNSWHELGCPDVKVEDDKIVGYQPVDSATCRGGRKNMTRVGEQCKPDYQPVGNDSVVVRTCNGASRTWEPERHLVCVPRPIIRLVNNRTYIDYEIGASANNSLLECVYHPDEGEEVLRVLWEMVDDDKFGTYEWRPGSEGIATGRLEGVVELNRDDGSLEFTELRYDLAGMYSCSVSLTNGITSDSLSDEVLIVDVVGKTSLTGYFEDCIYNTNCWTATVFPEPNVVAGMFSPKLGRYYQWVTPGKWDKVIHSTGAVTYSYSDVTFKITESTPDDIVFRFAMYINRPGRDGIRLTEKIIDYPAWHVFDGCPELVEEDNKEVNYYPRWSSATCRGGYKNMTNATVTCKGGYHAEGDVSIVTMRCNGTSLTWELEQGHTATTDDLVCVKNPATTTEYPGGGAASGNLSLVLLSTSLLGVVVLLFKFTNS